jgi:hypothetical protein
VNRYDNFRPEDDSRFACIRRGRDDRRIVESYTPPMNGPGGVFWRMGRAQPRASAS